jgi:hypothetical protein
VNPPAAKTAPFVSAEIAQVSEFGAVPGMSDVTVMTAGLPETVA